MFAPPVDAASSHIHSPRLSAFEQPMEKALDSDSTQSQLCFPNEFPYEFDSYAAISSPEAEVETNADEEGDFVAGLTRRLALFTQRLPSPPPPIVADKAKVNSTESTRGGLGSCTASGNKSPNGPFSQTTSPPETPCREEDSLRDISAAAKEAAKTKVSNFDAKPNCRPNPNPNSFVPFPQNAAFCNYNYYYYYWLHQQTQAALVTYQYPLGGVFAAPTAVKQPSAVTGVFTGPTAVKQQPQAADLVTYHYPVGGVFAAPTAVNQPSGVFTTATAVKQPCASTGVFTAPTAVNQPSPGTGVFFPKRCSNRSRSRKKEGKCVKLPTKVVQTPPPKAEKLSGRGQSRSQAHLSKGCSKLDRGTKSSVAGGCLKEERHLPEEWVY